MTKNGKYSDKIPALRASDITAKDTSEISTKVIVESSRPARFSADGMFLRDCGVVIPREHLDDLLYDLQHGLSTAVFVECFEERSLQANRYGVPVDIGDSGVISQVRIVLKSSGSERNKSLKAYNPHMNTIETLVYAGKKQNVPTRKVIRGGGEY